MVAASRSTKRMSQTSTVWMELRWFMPAAHRSAGEQGQVEAPVQQVQTTGAGVVAADGDPAADRDEQRAASLSERRPGLSVRVFLFATDDLVGRFPRGKAVS